MRYHRIVPEKRADQVRGFVLAVSPFDTEDVQEGWRAFLAKRPPQFRGH